MGEPTDDAAPPVHIAICASGTNTASLQRLLVNLDLPSRALLILILQHREALDEQALREALSTSGRAITAIRSGEPAVAGHIYLPDADVIVDMENGRFKTRAADRNEGHRGSIDSLLVALARDQGERVVAVALGGTNGDGTLGFKSVKDADGLTLAEDEGDADEDSLASSDRPAALADAVLPVADLPARLAAFVEQIILRGEGDRAQRSQAQEDAARTTIANILRYSTGHDFHGYKTGTFMRRVERRMQVVDAPNLQAYVEVLRGRSGEAQELFNDLLIGVTSFFRDPKEFERLATDIIPALFEGRGRGDQVRVWVIGCSTGEEAYSLGILLREHMATLDDAPHVQIFATDLDGRALAAARVGRYADAIAKDVGPERLGRWFVREGNTYCVVKELRELCIFSQHSIVKDAPFSRIDIVSCRNLLIYLDTALQERIIPFFHFALNRAGVLFLGNSENVSKHTRLFAPIDTHSRIFRRIDTGLRVLPDFPFSAVAPHSSTTLPAVVAPKGAELALMRRAERVVERYAPSYIVVDAAHSVLHFSARAGRYIEPAGGVASLELLQLVHRDLRLDLRAALAKAAENQPVQVEGVRLAQGGDVTFVDIVIEPIREESGRTRFYVVLFKESGSGRSDPSDPAVPSVESGRTQRLEAELQATRERLQMTNEVLESTNEELKASNEEYQALNEELQSMNEELQTSKEELQSVNEELTTLNSELGHRVRDLSRANSDLQNLMESTQIATLFLDNDLRVTSFTPAATDIFHLVESDKGRSLGHIKARISYEELLGDARRVLRTLAAIDRDITDEKGAHYIARVMPYRDTDNFIAGVVVTFVEVTALKRAERLLRQQEERFRAYVAAASTSMYRMSPDWSEMQEMDGKGILPDTPRPSTNWLSRYILVEDQPMVLDAIQKSIRSKSPFMLEHRVRRVDGRIGWISSRAIPLFEEDGSIREWFGAASELSDRKRGDGSQAVASADEN